MSRGPGRWQRTILAAVGDGWTYLVDLLPDGYSRAQYVALHRAACTLADAEKVEWLHYYYGAKKVAIGPAGSERPRRCVDLDGRHPPEESCLGCGGPPSPEVAALLGKR